MWAAAEQDLSLRHSPEMSLLHLQGLKHHDIWVKLYQSPLNSDLIWLRPRMDLGELKVMAEGFRKTCSIFIFNAEFPDGDSSIHNLN